MSWWVVSNSSLGIGRGESSGNACMTGWKGLRAVAVDVGSVEDVVTSSDRDDMR